MDKMQDYIRALEEEKIKIQMFQRELPLCLQLVTKAIESCKQQLSSDCNLQNEQSEGSDQTSSDVPPVLDEDIIRIPIPVPMTVKRASSNSDSGCEQHDFKKPKIDDISVADEDARNGNYGIDSNDEKPDWLRSAQLWNQTPDVVAPSKEIHDDSTKKVGVKRDGSGGAFHPFKKEKIADIVQPASTGLMARTGSGGTGSKKEEQEGPSRKSRRCWSPQLHKRFLQALHELGGSHVATPKQIRDLMKVDGLTNDEVKSHLQKYRLHTRRPSSSSQNITATTTQAPQFVVVTGGLWMPPEYTAAMTTPATSREAPKGIYAPIASLPPPFQETSASSTQRQHNDNVTSDSNVEGSHSPVTSSSTHTSTASLAY